MESHASRTSAAGMAVVMRIAKKVTADLRAMVTDAPRFRRKPEKPPAQQVAETGDQERNPGELADGGQVEVPHALEVLRKPEDVEIPDRVHEDLRHGENPDEARPEQNPKRDRRHTRPAGGRGRCAVEPRPECQ